MLQLLQELAEAGGEGFKGLCRVVTLDACEAVEIC